jgi:hypothetical protein
VVGSAVVGVRLVLLARRTRALPELLLGSAILGTAVLGYGTLVASLILRGGEMGGDAVSPLAVFLSGAGQILHDAGVTCFLLFTVYVFRREDRWARHVACVALLLLWGGLAWGAAHGSFRTGNVGTLAWYCEYAVVWTYPVWNAVEALRYGAMMRRRVRLGFADPLVANRFALWGLGSVFSALAIGIASIPFFLMDQPELLASATPPIRVATAIAGLASVSCSYLAFLPPAWYVRRVQAASARAAS